MAAVLLAAGCGCCALGRSRPLSVAAVLSALVHSAAALYALGRCLWLLECGQLAVVSVGVCGCGDVGCCLSLLSSRPLSVAAVHVVLLWAMADALSAVVCLL